MSREQVQAVKADIGRFMGVKDVDDPQQWYTAGGGVGMVELYQSSALWACRQTERVHGAFADILGTEELLVTLDRVSFKPPVKNSEVGSNAPYGAGLPLHWDLDISDGVLDMSKLQGVLCLSDTTSEASGGFTCVPGFHNEFEAWHKSLPEGKQRRRPFHKQPSLLARLKDYSFPITQPHIQQEIQEEKERNSNAQPLSVKHVHANAGDLIIWSSYIPHGNGTNTSDSPRIAQYISFYPAGGAGADTDFADPIQTRDASGRAQTASQAELARQRELRVGAWRTGRQTMAGAPAAREPNRRSSRFYGAKAELTALGRKILGIDPWR